MSGSLVSESFVGERTTEFDSKQSIFPEADGSPASARLKDDKFGADGTSEPINREKTSFELDGSTMSVLLDGERISLKAKEYALLKCLYDHKNTIVTKEVLFSEVWGDAFFTDGTLNVHIRKLREKIENDPNSPKIIKTVWGTGYILEI